MPYKTSQKTKTLNFIKGNFTLNYLNEYSNSEQKLIQR